MSVDYTIVGSTMAEVKARIVTAYTAALKGKYRPDSHMVWGAPGIGKTFTIYDAAREVAKHLSLDYIYVKSLMLSTMDPTDIVGVPHRHREFDYTQYLPLRWAWDASKEYEDHMRKTDKSFKAPPMVLFFDDFPVAHQQVQAACFKLFHEGQAGDLHIRDNVFLIAAGNRPEDNAAAQEMPTAMANRFRHIYAKVDASEWLQWAANDGNIHPLIVGYIRGHKTALHDFKADSPEKAFPSPRSWEMCSTAVKENEAEVKESVKTGKSKSTSLFKVTSGIIGSGFATELHAYLDQTRHAIPAEEIVKNPRGCKVPNSKEVDALHATVAELEYHVKHHPKEAWWAALVYSIRKEMVPEMGLILATATTHVITTLLSSEDMIEALATPEWDTMNDVYGEFLTAVR
ncbi:MAG: AAA family ATPase [Nitrososphaera sp.]|nr:AAA family ATPase [Nitrososphaera sp.]